MNDDSQNHRLKVDPLYLLADFLALLGLILFLFTLYIVPNVFLGLTYPLPDFLFEYVVWVQGQYNLSAFSQKLAIFLPFLGGSFSLLIFAKIITAHLEAKDNDLSVRSREPSAGNDKDWINLTLLLVAIVVLVSLGVFFVNLLL